MLIDVYVVQEFAAAGTPAFDVLAEVEGRPELELFEPVVIGDTDRLEAKVTNVDLYPGDILQEWMFGE